MRAKSFFYGIIDLNGVYIKVGFYHPSFSMTKIELLLLALRYLLIDIHSSNANFQVMANHHFPINQSKVQLHLRIPWQDIKQITSNLN